MDGSSETGDTIRIAGQRRRTKEEIPFTLGKDFEEIGVRKGFKR